VQKELVTPTGALIVSSYASSFGALPPMKVEHTGYGAGDNDFPTTPNVLRVLIGESAPYVASGLSRTHAESGFPGTEPTPATRVVVIECEIDDMNPQIFGVVMERLYAAGAYEVFYVSVQMKKNRPGTLLTVVAPPVLRGSLSDIIFRETTTIGLRYSEVDRECLVREHASVETSLGTVRMKLAWREGKLVNAVPEFDDWLQRTTCRSKKCRRSPSKHGDTRREPLLHHHSYLLHQRRTASRSRVYDDDCGLRRACPSSDGRRGVLPHGHRRTRAESRAGGAEGRHSNEGLRGSDLREISGAVAAVEHFE
jgi:hypothetical protein